MVRIPGGNSVGVIVPVLKNFKGFTELIESIDISFVPYVIDNWNENRGVSGGWNEGLAMAIEDSMDAVFIVNDDVVFEAGTMTKMLYGLHQYDMVTGYNTRDENYDHLDKPQFIDSPDFSCFVVDPINFVYKFGWFDTNFTPAYFEDNDMHYRMKISGGKAKKYTDAPFHHKGSVTQNWDGQQVVTGTMFEANREYYRWKWGGYPGEETLTVPRPPYLQDQEEGISL